MEAHMRPRSSRYRTLLAGLLLLLSVLAPVHAQDAPAQTLNAALDAYSQGAYGEAARLLEEALEQGWRNGALFYNLGRAYEQSGDTARAYLNYRRAQQYVPRDGDLDRRLALTRNDLNLPREHSNILVNVNATIVETVTLWELSLLTFGVWALGFLLLTVYAFIKGEAWRENVRLLLALVGVSWGVLAGALGTRLFVETTMPPAVNPDETRLMSGPDETYIVFDTLSAGRELHVLEERDNWARVLLPDGRQGWVPLDTLAFIG